jgi:hypothetical protein
MLGFSGFLEREVELGKMVGEREGLVGELRSKWLYILIRRKLVRNLVAPPPYKEPKIPVVP